MTTIKEVVWEEDYENNEFVNFNGPYTRPRKEVKEVREPKTTSELPEEIKLILNLRKSLNLLWGTI